VTFAADFSARLAEGNVLAPSLVGLKRGVAVERVKAGGFEVQAISAAAGAISADLAANRIRLILDEDDKVVRAWAG
jgi:hypothetical protein